MSRTLVIAEAGVNHNGRLDLALALVDAAAEAGADVVKFQTFSASALTTGAAAKADYQSERTGAGESQQEMLRRLELDDAAHRAIIARCGQRGIRFLSTPFDFLSLGYLVKDLQVDILKLPSGEVTNGPFLLEAARSGRDIILSTGMAVPEEIGRALAVLAFGYSAPADARPDRAALDAALAGGRGILGAKVTLLHCTTAYPTPFEDVNLRAMVTLARTFGLPVGYSDHTPGITVPVAAVALGARVVEKHLTMDRSLPGPDHAASLEPAEFGAMIRAIRETEAALGSPDKRVAPSEAPNIPVARKSVVAARAINQGETFCEDNLALKRPGTGLSPMCYWDLLGLASDRDYQPDEAIAWPGGDNE